MRWFGPHDPVSLMDIRQAGCAGVVTALHHIPVGDVWSVAEITNRKELIEQNNDFFSPLHWVVVESLPVHEDIKKGLPGRDILIHNYQESLRNLAACGITTVCYNFMPVLDWSRTDLNFAMPDGAGALRFVWQDFALFDLFILQRPEAEKAYSTEVQKAARHQFEQLTPEQILELTNTVLLGLPGSEEAFELRSFQSLLDQYQLIGDAELRQNLYYFIQQVAPLAEELGLKLCIHPDDPPFPLLGLPRVVSTEEDLAQLLEACPVSANGITFCTGSLGIRPDNDLTAMIRRFYDRIHFVHLRTTKREANPRNFHEAAHLEGDVDMYEVIKTFVMEEKQNTTDGVAAKALPMRPDHGHQMLDDLHKKTYPGYSAIGRLKGLAELRGLELAIRRTFLTLLLLGGCLLSALADDGYRLWLKYDPLPVSAVQKEYTALLTAIAPPPSDSPVAQTAVKELRKGLEGLLNKKITLQTSVSISENGVVFTLNPSAKLDAEGYHLYRKGKQTIIEAKTEKGLLYGTFGLLRHLQTLGSLTGLDLVSNPKIQLRMLNHWDNVLGTIERGYAGSSLWKWYELPERMDPRYEDYARANASIGINAVAVNNVNASARFMTAEYLIKVKALADVFRPYGIKVFLSVNFAAPRILGKWETPELKTSDPLDPQVQQWWKDKAKEIYTLIPDFGGFLVKANSEGEPGPQDYKRTHADGANMLAKAVAPQGGVVIWRAFVYSPNPQGDRFKEAYNEFKPLDGQFDSNVIVQVKNGPIDFQPREPFSPLFGAMPKTPLAMEFQITQEYLGFTTNLTFLASMYKECLESDTYANGKGTTVAKVIDGSAHQYPLTAIAGVANTGSDRNWTGHFMSQANWYSFGRLAWDHGLSEETLADEWIKMTLTRVPSAVKTIREMLLVSHETYVNFTTPLGLHHIMGQNIHFGPEPWLERSRRPDWTSIYYHRADSLGLGFDRTASGSNALTLYRPEVQAQWNNPATCPLPYLLWFHHVAWDTRLSTGQTLWNELCTRYYEGVNGVADLQKQWKSVENHIDEEIFDDVAGRLAVQHREALNWRDACVLYFQTYAKRPIPAPYPTPERSLDELKKLVEIYQLR
ncbi:mannonate dehydratase [Arundinibacter roseus]|uniref:Mannonate dehydratase n=1 Tax=Arundinibacter roseus TaxID=2070510 RepID=A0A4R4JWG1_9BACT|nr:mannonate dehydratase [Arundinibacter roseus]